MGASDLMDLTASGSWIEMQEFRCQVGADVHIDPHEAKTIQEALWLSWCESRYHGVSNSAETHMYCGCVALFFNRSVHVLGRLLLNTPLVQALQNRGVSIEPDWAQGALVLTDALRE